MSNAEHRWSQEVRLGLSRLVRGEGPWHLDYGPCLIMLTVPPRLDPCGGSGTWWWGFGRRSNRPGELEEC